MAFLTPFALPVIYTSTKPSTSPRYRKTRPRTMEPKATLAAPTTPTNPPENSHPTAVPWMPLPGVVHEIRTPEEYDRLAAVAAENGQLLVLDFMAAWCRKCKYLLPKLRKLAIANPAGYFGTVDVNKVTKLPKLFNITKMPTFAFVENRETVATLIGGAEPTKVAEQLESKIAELCRKGEREGEDRE